MSPQVWPPVPGTERRRWFAAGELVVINPYWNVGLTGGYQLIPALAGLSPLAKTPVIRRQDGTTGLHAFTYEQISAGAPITRSLSLSAASASSVTALYSASNNGGSQLPAGWMVGKNVNPVWLDAT